MAKTLKQATQRPKNIGARVPDPPPQQVPYVAPQQTSSLNKASLGPSPALWTNPESSVRQWYRPGTSQTQYPTFPSKVNPQLNAQASSVYRGASATSLEQIAQQQKDISALQTQGWQGAWSSTVSYFTGAIVDFNGVIYLALQTAANQTPPNLNNQPDTSPTFWQATGQASFAGAFDPTISYSQGQIVDDSGIFYISLINSNLGNTPASSPSDWAPISTSASVFVGIWNSGTAYVLGNQVTFSGTKGNGYYIALVDNTNKQPDTNPSDWQQIGAPNSYVFLGAYNGATAYVPGNQVSYIGSYWICISATTGNAPGVGSSFWEQVGQAAILLQPWSSSIAYTQGMEVLYLGTVYQCILANTNEQPNISPAYWTLVSNPATAVGFQMISNPDFQNGLTGYSVYDNNSTGHVTLSLASNSAAPGGFGQTLEISVSAGGESPGLGGFYYATALDSGVVVLDHYHVGDTYIVSVWANIPVGYTLNFTNNSLGTGGSVTPISTSYAGTGGWVNYVWQVIVGTSPGSPNSFPFFYLSGTFSTAFNWYVAQLSITDINQPARGNQNLFLGAWSGATPYVPGNEIVYDGNYWICTTANTNQSPAVGSAYWQVSPVNPASGALGATGSTPNTTGTGFTYTSTTTSITINWSGLTLFRADNTTTTVPNGSQTITGLTANTTYYFYPTWVESTSTLEFIDAAEVPSLVAVTGVLFTAATSGYVSTATSVTPNTSSVSIEFWTKFTSAGSACLVEHCNVQTGTPTQTNVFVGVTGGQVRVALHGSGGLTPFVVANGNQNDGNWHHVAVTFSGTTAKIYIDGVANASGSVATASYGAGFWRISSDQGGGNDNVANATVADVAIYDGVVLTSTQVIADYNSMAAGSQSAYQTTVLGNGPTYFWHLTETTGTSAADSAGSNTGTYQATHTLGSTSNIGPVTGSPAIAWMTKLYPVAQAQGAQGNVPLSAGAMALATPAGGSGGGSSGGAGGGKQVL